MNSSILSIFIIFIKKQKTLHELKMGFDCFSSSGDRFALISLYSCAFDPLGSVPRCERGLLDLPACATERTWPANPQEVQPVPLAVLTMVPQQVTELTRERSRKFGTCLSPVMCSLRVKVWRLVQFIWGTTCSLFTSVLL